jgi:putative hydrolases of HD superfamily
MEDLFKFVEFTQKFQKVQRVILIKDEERWENDAEHSYQLALVAWYIINKEKLNLDLNKIIFMAIAHDLVEIYAGDTYIFGTQELKASKKEREAKAIKMIGSEFPEFDTLIPFIQEYEERTSEESKFIYALDKLLPNINNVLDNGRIWHREKVTYEMLRNDKDSKIAVSPEIEKYWKEFIEILEKDKEKLFVE